MKSLHYPSVPEMEQTVDCFHLDEISPNPTGGGLCWGGGGGLCWGGGSADKQVKWNEAEVIFRWHRSEHNHIKEQGEFVAYQIIRGTRCWNISLLFSWVGVWGWEGERSSGWVEKEVNAEDMYSCKTYYTAPLSDLFPRLCCIPLKKGCLRPRARVCTW